jgi:hypothetical protein
MNPNENFTVSTWIDPDDAPLLDEEWFRTADLYDGDKLIRRGRPSTDKVSTTIRFDRHILDAFRKSGKGWQTRMNDALKEWLQTHPAS